MSFLDNLFKKKKQDEIPVVPKLEPAELDTHVPSFSSHVEEHLPPAPEDFGVKKEPSISKEIMPKGGEIPKVPDMEKIEEPKLEPVGKPEMPAFITPHKEEPKAEHVQEPVVHEVDINKPVFVLIDDYKRALTFIGEIKLSLREAGEVFDALGRLKNDEDKAYGMFYNNIEDIQRKLVFADQSLFENRG